jgi:MFS family permease
MKDTNAPNKRATLTFVLLCIMAFVMYVDRTNISVAAPVIGKEFGLSNTSLGVIFSAFAIAYSCFMIPGGWLSDRIGAPKGLFIYGIIWSVATVATGMVGSLVALAVARFFVGVGEAPIYPTAARLITNVIAQERRGSAQGIMHACGRVAASVAPLIVTSLIVAFSWRMSFVVLGVVTVVYMAAMYGVIGRSRQPVPGNGQDAASDLERARKQPVDWPHMIKRVWPTAATCFCHGWVLWFFLNWIPSYFSQRYGMNLKHSAIFTTCVLLGGTVGTAVGGMIADWRLKRSGDRLRARRGMIVFGFLAAILGLVPMFFTHDVTISAACLSFSFFCSELADSPLWVLGAEVVPSHSATSSACTFTGMALAGALSPLIIGWLLDATGGQWAVAFGASIAVLVIGPVLSMFIELDDGEVSVEGGTHRTPAAHRTPIGPAAQATHIPSASGGSH